MTSLAALVAACGATTVDGTWQRHVSASRADRALDGHAAYGRWGTAGSFPVLYLGRPGDSVVIEAYRHLVDPVDDPAIASTIKPRVLVTCALQVGRVLDLRVAANRLQVNLSAGELQSGTEDGLAYARCQAVAQVAHQLGLSGVVAPAATGRGETLALFTDLLAPSERPVRVDEDRLWARLPQDPRQAHERRLRVVRDEF